MKISDSFSIVRIGNLLKYEIAYSGSTLLKHLLFGYIGLTAILMVILSISDAELRSATNVILLMGLMCLIQYYNAGMTRNINEKTGRTAYLMLPGSKGEKFVTRLIMCLIIFPLTIFVALVMSDITLYIIGFGDSIFSVTSELYELNDRIYWNVDGPDIIPEISSASFFLLAGCIWSRHAYLKSIGVSLILFILISIAMGVYMAVTLQTAAYDEIIGSINSFMYTIPVYQIIAFVIFMLLAYRLFGRKQIA